MQLADTALAHAITDRLKTLFKFMSISPGIVVVPSSAADVSLADAEGVSIDETSCQVTRYLITDWIIPASRVSPDRNGRCHGRDVDCRMVGVQPSDAATAQSVEAARPHDRARPRDGVQD